MPLTPFTPLPLKTEDDFFDFTDYNDIATPINRANEGVDSILSGAAFASSPTYADNATALAALGAGKVYKNATGQLFVSYAEVAPTGNVYWGERAEGSAALTNAQIKATTPHTYTPGADITATFTNTTPKILWVAFPSTETGIAFYFANAFDKGPLSGSAFAQTTLGDLTVLTTQYGTQFPDPVVFRHTAA